MAGKHILLTSGRIWSALALTRKFGRLGYQVEVVDSSQVAVSRYSKYCVRFHRAPSLTESPTAFGSFIVDLVKKRKYEFVVPVFEEVIVLGKFRDEILKHSQMLVVDYNSYLMLHNKTSLYKFCVESGITTPWSVPCGDVSSSTLTSSFNQFPVFVKFPFTCGSIGTRKANNESELIHLLDQTREMLPQNQLLHPIIQQSITGYQIATQAVYKQGRILALHMYQNIVEYPPGSGTGVVRESVWREDIRLVMEKIGRILNYEGFLGIDFIIDQRTGQPFLIDANPRVPLGIHNACLSEAGLAEAYASAFSKTPLTFSNYQLGIRTRFSVFHWVWLVRSLVQRKNSIRTILWQYWQNKKNTFPEVYDKKDIVPILMAPLIIIKVFLSRGENVMVRYARGCAFTLDTYLKFTAKSE